MIKLSKGPDELSENDRLKGDELSGSDCTLVMASNCRMREREETPEASAWIDSEISCVSWNLHLLQRLPSVLPELRPGEDP